MLRGQPNQGFNFAFLLNCTPVRFRLKDVFIDEMVSLMLWLLSGTTGFACWISLAAVFSVMYC